MVNSKKFQILLFVVMIISLLSATTITLQQGTDGYAGCTDFHAYTIALIT